jgi:hypothetical protein
LLINSVLWIMWTCHTHTQETSSWNSALMQVLSGHFTDCHACECYPLAQILLPTTVSFLVGVGGVS